MEERYDREFLRVQSALEQLPPSLHQQGGVRDAEAEVPGPLRGYARVHVEYREYSCHLYNKKKKQKEEASTREHSKSIVSPIKTDRDPYLEIHYGAAQKRDGQKYGRGDFEYFELTVLVHVGHEDDGTEDAKYGECQERDP